jgi:hypothetical protein
MSTPFENFLEAAGRYEKIEVHPQTLGSGAVWHL